ncbi:hypothetical protein J3E72DRAFT_377840 [Bipolaris maydis]|nr:hypothetical protein J3E74DRAFT_413346 [Bipolaris maydis]KAJ5057256.1 hypothetical protein J3E74DRAFT_409946 [Bipolaris maydis]KAJ6194217.1 hypothetical protein J3E72DRAFT_377840 [Bipolaris maydis]
MDVEAINKSLLKAVEEGDLAKIQDIVFRIPGSRTGQDWSFLSREPVLLACSKGDVDIVEFLLKHCQQEDFTDISRRTALIHQAVRGEGADHCNTVKLLLGFAAGDGGAETVKKYVNIQDHEGKTAVHHVAAEGDYAMLDVLFEAGVEVTIRDKRGLLPAHIACIEKKYETMRWLFQKDQVGIAEIMKEERIAGTTCLHLVSKRNCGKALGYLLDLIQDEQIMSKDSNRMSALFGKLLIEDRIKTQDMKRFIEGFQYEQYIRNRDDTGPVVLKLREPSCTVTHGGGSKSFTIAMPYFKVLKQDRVLKWRDSAYVNAGLQPFISHRSNCPSGSLESLKAPYLPLTLDEYCCPALPKSMLDRRNRDQVLAKADNTESLSPEIVTVCQVWVLQCEDGLIVTHEPDVEFFSNHSELEFPSWGHDCLTGDAKRYIGILLSHFVDNLDRPSETGSGNPVFHTFENFIASCALVVDEYSRGDDLKKLDIDKERRFLHDIDDIRGELGMIKRVILQQEEVWKTFASNAWPEHWSSGAEGRMVVKDDEGRSLEEEEEWQLILRAQTQFDRFRRRIAQLDEDAARMEKSIMAKLDLKQKHASLQESHATAVMSAAVLGFTVITIIFTPLSFLTSLFALSIDRFQRNQVDFYIPNRENEVDFSNRTRVYTTNYIGKWAATTELASIAVALLSMWFVIEYGMDVPVLRYSATRLVGLTKRIWEFKFVTKVSGRIKSKRLRRPNVSIPVFVRRQLAIRLKNFRRRWQR